MSPATVYCLHILSPIGRYLHHHSIGSTLDDYRLESGLPPFRIIGERPMLYESRAEDGVIYRAHYRMVPCPPAWLSPRRVRLAR